MVRLIAVTILLINSCYAQTVILACGDSANPPFIIGGGTKLLDERPGVSIEMLKLVEEQLNIKLTLLRLPWQRGLKAIAANKVDGLFHSSFKPERLAIGVYPIQNGKPDIDKRMLNWSYVLYKLNSSPLNWDGKQFTELNGAIGATRGYAIVDQLVKLSVDVEEVENTLQNMEKLVAGRIAGIADLETMGDFILKKYPEKYSQVIKIKTPLRTKAYFLMLSHQFVQKNPKLAEDIWSTIQLIRESDKYNDILRKYM
ncbi:transporter substrate-binding domain-containing protein [Endozoicomonas sp. SM1973]|uniref:Transporter substrate-binding domain-containing protein n=1 Tax=Spartinivicinus marinus TaxID=2994442 RepID=A0A853I569_9GAMM|nr:transporter substrate-binding domain-containing protein [Spartinivicinus marinus]MCX4027819.1 transporter substrate-binding domain-containing protein [Spartinivicinus marinus]NYZ69040.1 transporter substrate-binding domain-containing protein [Spartinivicinus marinus]